MTISRRRFLQLTGALLATGSLNGCFLTKKLKLVCPFDPAFTDVESILAIDVHSHVFNATDLQVKDFVRRVAVRQSGGIGKLAEFFGGLLQTFAWASAPDVSKELRKLVELEPMIFACDYEENIEELRALREQKYTEGKSELTLAVQKRMQELSMDPVELSGPMEALPAGSKGFKQILALPDTYEGFVAPPSEAELLLEGFSETITVKSALKFVVEMFQYRFVSIYNYLETYSKDSELKIDLMVPAAVDFDWWLSKGVPTRSSLPDQMALMKKISILTGGRVHALVPFDPFRQVVHDVNGNSGFSPIDLVKTSIEDYGAIGVKLYPPMGFAPFGNEDVGAANPDMWKQPSWLPELAKRDDFPKLLDLSLKKLYQYCAKKNVPVMGHSNESNGPSEDFERLTSPQYWESAISSFKDVSFSFGHFGGAGSARNDNDSNARGFLKLMEADQTADRKRIAADASYFSNILDNPVKLANAMEDIYKFGVSDPRPAVDRLMYGADWKMLVTESGASDYLNDFNNVMTHLQDKLGIPDLKKKFFGQNAAEFLGLKQNQDNRTRLEEFYNRNGVEKTPVWMDKVDGQL